MDVEPCYPLFSAELESAEALASSQQKFYTLNLAECNVMRQFLLVTLVCSPICLGCMRLNPDRKSDEKFTSWILLSLQQMTKLYDLWPMTAAGVVENLSEDNE